MSWLRRNASTTVMRLLIALSNASNESTPNDSDTMGESNAPPLILHLQTHLLSDGSSSGQSSDNTIGPDAVVKVRPIVSDDTSRSLSVIEISFLWFLPGRTRR
jgi:hypothetical protein